MKKDIHPNYQEFKIIFPNGQEFVTRSASKDKELYLDVDFNEHPAWSGKTTGAKKGANIEKFKNKYGDAGF